MPTLLSAAGERRRTVDPPAMRYALPSIGSGWRGFSASLPGGKPRNRLSEAWWAISDPKESRLTYALQGEGQAASLDVAGTIGAGDLHIEVALDPARLAVPPTALCITVAGPERTVGTLKRVALRRRAGAVAGAAHRLWRTATPIALSGVRTAVPFDDAEAAAIVAFSRDVAAAGDQLWLALTFGAGPVDIRLSGLMFEFAPAPSAIPDRSETDEAATDAKLAAAIRKLVAGELPRRLREHLAAQDWAALDQLAAVVGDILEPLARAAWFAGRAQVLRGDHGAAAAAFDKATRFRPDDTELRLSLGLSLVRADDLDRGIAELRTVLAQSATARARIDLARALRRRSGEGRDAARAGEDRREAIAQLSALASDELDGAPRLMLADLLYEQGASAECLAVLDRGPLGEGTEVAGLILRSRALVALDRIEESFEPAREALALEPDNSAAAFHLRAFRHFRGGARPAPKPVAFVLAGDGFRARLAACGADWVLPVDAAGPHHERRAIPAPASAGGVATAAGVTLWRRDSLAILLDSGLVAADLADLPRFEALFRRDGPADDAPGTTVALLSRGAHDLAALQELAEHWRALGYAPILLMAHDHPAGDAPVAASGHRTASVVPSAPALLRCLVEHDAAILHALSGSGALAVAAVAHSRIRLLYGIHTDPADDGSLHPEPDAPDGDDAIAQLLAHADIYAGSTEIRSALEHRWGMRVPLLPLAPAIPAG